MTVEQILAKFRDALGTQTQRELAFRLGISPARLGMWRIRGRISYDGIRLLLRSAGPLGVPLSAEDFFPPQADSAQPPSAGDEDLAA